GRCPGSTSPPALRPVRPREPEPGDGPTPVEILAAIQAAVVDRFFYPGHRPSASAPGWDLPARWAGGLTCNAQVVITCRALSDPRDRVAPSTRDAPRAKKTKQQGSRLGAGRQRRAPRMQCAKTAA